MKWTTVTLASALIMPTAVSAQEGLSLGFGGKLTSNYIFRGTTQSDDRPAIQGYVEGDIGGFYLGAWASTVDLDDDRVEFNLYAGFRNSVGALDYDIGYVRYLYDDSGDCCGEIYLALDSTFEPISFGATAFHDFDLDTQWVETRSQVAWSDWVFGGSIGTDFGSLDLERGNKVAWDLGVTRYFDAIALDLRYHDSNDDPGRVVVSISADF